MMQYRTRAAKRNLREGIKKMEKVMSPAAQVRRDFRWTPAESGRCFADCTRRLFGIEL